MNKVLEIVLRFSKHRTGFHTDIKKIYDTVQLRQEGLCLQRFTWQKDIGKRKIL